MAHISRLSTLVSLQHVSFHFDNGTALFDALNLTFDHTRTAIVGRNGIGKSILARLIAGQVPPSSGKIDRFGSVAFVGQDVAALAGQSVAQIAGLADVLAALERLASGTADPHDLDLVGDRWDLAARFQHSVAEAGLPGLDPLHPVESLSGGQAMRVALIGALLSNADLLVLDEPTNHLDQPGRHWLRSMLEAWRGGLIVVSHDRRLLNEVASIVELTPHGAHLYGGNYEVFHTRREAEQQAAQAALDHARTDRSRELRRLQLEHDTIHRHAAGARRAAETANVSSMARFGMKHAATEILGRVRQNQQAVKEQLNLRVSEAAARLIPDSAVLVSLPDAVVTAHRQVFTLHQARLPWLADIDPASCLSWSVSGPARIALTGPNGCGKSTLLRLLAGELLPSTGTCATHVPCAYLDQRLEVLDGEISVVEQLAALGTSLAEGVLRSRLALLQLDARRATQATKQLSGGERLKAALACALWRHTPAQLLLLDEPTNHLDLESVLAFQTALRDFPGAIVAASHDTDFLDALRPTHTLRWTHTGWLFEPCETVVP